MHFILLTISVLATEVFTSDYSVLEQHYFDLNDAAEIFEEFTRKYEKNYEGERDYKFEVFKQNLEKINKLNEDSGTNGFGVNEFSDMTFEEFSSFYLGFDGNATGAGSIVYNPTEFKAPPSLDWRSYGYVSDVKNQGNIEGQYAKTHSTRAISLSEQQGLDCESTGSCNGGIPHLVFQALATQGGSMREEDYPYENRKGQCRTRRDRVAVTVTGGNQLSVYGEDSLKEAVANYGPLSIALCADASFKSYRGNVFRPMSSCFEANHAVLLVGYGNDGYQDYWIIKNSWGVSWGERGYMRLVKGQNACAIGSYVATSTVA